MLNFTPPKHRIYLIIIAFFFIFLGFDGAMQYLAALYTQQGIQHLAFNSQIILYIVFLLSNIFSTKLINPLGLKKAVILGAFTYFLFVLALLSKNPSFIYPASVLIGVGASLLWVSSRQIITLNSSKDDVGKYLSFQLSSFIFGRLVGTTIGAVLIQHVTFGMLYLFFSLMILVGVPILLLVQATDEKLPVESFNPFYITKRHVLLLSLIAFTSTFISIQSQNGLSLLTLSRFGLAMVGVFATTVIVPYAVSSLLIGFISHRLKHMHYFSPR